MFRSLTTLVSLLLQSDIRKPLLLLRRRMHMKLARRIWYSNFFIRLRSWEYWPFGVVQLPLMFYWLWLWLKARSLFFFSASHPSILLGGMFGESKFQILKRVPEHLLPKTRFIRYPATHSELFSVLKENFTFPVIFKPDIGERG